MSVTVTILGERHVVVCLITCLFLQLTWNLFINMTDKVLLPLIQILEGKGMNSFLTGTVIKLSHPDIRVFVGEEYAC